MLKGALMSFRDELGGIARESRAGLDEKGALHANALAYRGHASRIIRERVHDLANFLNQYRHLGLPTVSYDPDKSR